MLYLLCLAFYLNVINVFVPEANERGIVNAAKNKAKNKEKNAEFNKSGGFI